MIAQQQYIRGLPTTNGSSSELEVRAKVYDKQATFPGVVFTIAEVGKRQGRASLRLEPAGVKELIDFLESLDLG